MLFRTISLKQMILASLFAALTGIGAFLIIPMYPVPITLQTFFTYLSGMVLGKKVGTLSQVLYLFLGFIGLPFFAGGKSGPGVLLGPTGGYLWGFVFSAYVIGLLVERKNIKRTKEFIIVGMIGIFIINFSGAVFLQMVTQLNLKAIFLSGFLPFVIGDFFKILAASLVASKLKLVLL